MNFTAKGDYDQALGAFDWELPEDMHPDFFVGDTAKWWLESYPKQSHSFCRLASGATSSIRSHSSLLGGLLKKDLPLLEVTKEELSALPDPLQKLRKHNNEVDHDSVVLDLEPSREQRHRQWAYYLANVTMIDEKIGEILHTLENLGYLENGIVVFCSDHGDCLTDHGHSQKWTMYDLITRVPMVVWAPGIFEGSFDRWSLSAHGYWTSNIGVGWSGCAGIF